MGSPRPCALHHSWLSSYADSRFRTACACCLAVNSGLSAALAGQGDNVITSYAQGALASYFLFNIVFSFTYTPLQGVIPSEALETTMRAKGLAASGVIVSAIGFINQFATPIGLGNIGYKFIYIFVGWDIVETIIWYFFWYVALRFFLLPSRLHSSVVNETRLTGFLIPQRRVPGPHPRAAGLDLRATQPCQGLPQGRQGHCPGRRKGYREGCGPHHHLIYISIYISITEDAKGVGDCLSWCSFERCAVFKNIIYLSCQRCNDGASEFPGSSSHNLTCSLGKEAVPRSIDLPMLELIILHV